MKLINGKRYKFTNNGKSYEGTYSGETGNIFSGHGERYLDHKHWFYSYDCEDIALINTQANSNQL